MRRGPGSRLGKRQEENARDSALVTFKTGKRARSRIIGRKMRSTASWGGDRQGTKSRLGENRRTAEGEMGLVWGQQMFENRPMMSGLTRNSKTREGELH